MCYNVIISKLMSPCVEGSSNTVQVFIVSFKLSEENKKI